MFTTKSIEDPVNKRIFQYENDDKFLFKRLMKLIMSDPHMAEDLRYNYEYIVCVVIKGADNLATDRDFDPVDEDLTNTENVSMYHRYIQTPLDPHHETFKEAIKVNHYEKMCWINTITGYYKDTLMGDHRREKNKLTKESILQLINKTGDDFTTYGASIRDMIPVFDEYKIQVRIINEFDRPIFIYDPPKRVHHIPALYALVKKTTYTP